MGASGLCRLTREGDNGEMKRRDQFDHSKQEAQEQEDENQQSRPFISPVKLSRSSVNPLSFSPPSSPLLCVLPPPLIELFQYLWRRGHERVVPEDEQGELSRRCRLIAAPAAPPTSPTAKVRCDLAPACGEKAEVLKRADPDPALLLSKPRCDLEHAAVEDCAAAVGAEESPGVHVDWVAVAAAVERRSCAARSQQCKQTQTKTQTQTETQTKTQMQTQTHAGCETTRRARR